MDWVQVLVDILGPPRPDRFSQWVGWGRCVPPCYSLYFCFLFSPFHGFLSMNHEKRNVENLSIYPSTVCIYPYDLHSSTKNSVEGDVCFMVVFGIRLQSGWVISQL